MTVLTQEKSLDQCRGGIDAIDATLVHLLNLRVRYALDAGRVKRSQGAALHAPGREADILTRIQGMNGGPLRPETLAAIYELILHDSLQVQESDACGAGR
ncbi:MAG TPA: chorismate mutase [Terriglobales bacterium]|nr:chorismate mutase [Terriglobales bacterium]